MRERGSVTPMLAAVAGLAVVLGSLLVGLQVLVTARVGVQTAADAAALAAVDGGRPAAALAAAANGAEVVRCRCPAGGPAAVVVRSRLRLGPLGPIDVIAGARAAWSPGAPPGPRRPARHTSG